MGPSLGSARARPGTFMEWLGSTFWEGPRLDFLRRAQARLFEKGPENWSFYGVKIRGSSRLGPDFFRSIVWPIFVENTICDKIGYSRYLKYYTYLQRTYWGSAIPGRNISWWFSGPKMTFTIFHQNISRWRTYWLDAILTLRHILVICRWR